MSTQPRLPRADRCCTCGRPRGLTQKRGGWSHNETATIPHTANPAEHGDQITNDIVCHAGIWRNGGTGEDTHLCDDCLRVGLRVLKLKIDELLGVTEAGADKDAELAALTERLGLVQYHHQWLAYEHDRMQVRLGKMMGLIAEHGIAETDEIRHARFEVERGPAIKKRDEYLFVGPSTHADIERLDWLEAHPARGEYVGGVEDGRPIKVWAISCHPGITLRQAIDAAAQAKAAEGGR